MRFLHSRYEWSTRAAWQDIRFLPSRLEGSTRAVSQDIRFLHSRYERPPRAVSQETRFLRSRSPACRKIYGFCVPLRGKRACPVARYTVFALHFEERAPPDSLARPATDAARVSGKVLTWGFANRRRSRADASPAAEAASAPAAGNFPEEARKNRVSCDKTPRFSSKWNAKTVFLVTPGRKNRMFCNTRAARPASFPPPRSEAKTACFAARSERRRVKPVSVHEFAAAFFTARRAPFTCTLARSSRAPSSRPAARCGSRPSCAPSSRPAAPSRSWCPRSPHPLAALPYRQLASNGCSRPVVAPQQAGGAP